MINLTSDPLFFKLFTPSNFEEEEEEARNEDNAAETAQLMAECERKVEEEAKKERVEWVRKAKMKSE